HNRTMLDREVHFKVPLPIKMISEYRSRQGIGGEVGAAGGVLMKKDTLQCEEDVLFCRGLLNEVRTFFEGEEGCSG
ncbi:MAG: hypothetical protein GQ579_00600, partial [Bacteroidales bacterium]|nr:hypothetical protein [Bacteroidales bacterium]